MKVEFTKEELDIVCHALMLRENAMLRDAEAYRDQRTIYGTPNLEAQKDCMNEWRNTNKLHERLRRELIANEKVSES